jgi:hypothetical protein
VLAEVALVYSLDMAQTVTLSLLATTDTDMMNKFLINPFTQGI